VDDLLAFSRQLEESALAAEIATAEDGYGAGWIVDRAFERRRMHHNGILPGFVSDFIRFPDDRITIVLLSNVDRVRLSRIARDVSAIVLGQPFDMPVIRKNMEKFFRERWFLDSSKPRPARGELRKVVFSWNQPR